MLAGQIHCQSELFTNPHTRMGIFFFKIYKLRSVIRITMFQKSLQEGLPGDDSGGTFPYFVFIFQLFIVVDNIIFYFFFQSRQFLCDSGDFKQKILL